VALYFLLANVISQYYYLFHIRKAVFPPSRSKQVGDGLLWGRPRWRLVHDNVQLSWRKSVASIPFVLPVVAGVTTAAISTVSPPLGTGSFHELATLGEGFKPHL